MRNRASAMLITAVVGAMCTTPVGMAGGAATDGGSLVRLHYATFDPLVEQPEVATALRSGAGNELYIVQFDTLARVAERRQVERVGGRVCHVLPECALVVRMTPAVRDAVAGLAGVRWVGAYHPAYRLDGAARAHVLEVTDPFTPERYSILVFTRGDAQERVATRIEELGGTTDRHDALGVRLEASLTGDQLRAVAALNDVAFIDRAGPPGVDMDIVREVTGANYSELMGGYTGEGVRGEILDVGEVIPHCDLQSNPVIFHTPNGNGGHGMSSLGIAFGDGTCNPAARGMLPNGQPIYADWYQAGPNGQHMAELVDPNGPYQAVFQTRSVGSPRTSAYTTISAEMDDALFQTDLLVMQSMSNAGTNQARPEAWAKNIVSVGGVLHRNTLSLADDCWCNGSSTGPAADGRIKPDLVHFYDNILTLGGCWDCYMTISGTSASTPIVAGCFGLFFQMWADGIFGNRVDPNGTVFSNRPHMATAKAMMINTAHQYPFSGPQHDLTRYHQGWGLADVRNPYDLQDRMHVVDEARALEEGQVARYRVLSDGGEDLKATLVYTDPPGNPASPFARVNDLTLKVTSPSDVVYWGNHGLLTGNYSTPGGEADKADTVECVFVKDPELGSWQVEVHASTVVVDAQPETLEIDAAFGLVVSGIRKLRLGDLNCDGVVNFGDINPFVMALTDPNGYMAAYPDCTIHHGDMNCDGLIDFGDINAYVNCISFHELECTCP